MNTTSRPVEPALDDQAVASAAAVYAARLAALTDLETERRVRAQRRFDTSGLPRGLYRIEAA